jgi:hypothetical protein
MPNRIPHHRTPRLWMVLTAVVAGGGGGSVVRPPLYDTTAISCVGLATYTAVGPHQATGDGALSSQYSAYSIPGGVTRTVAVKRGFLELNRPLHRQYGTQIVVSPQDGGVLARTGGPAGPFTVSDYGDKHIHNTQGVAFDIYRWGSQKSALQFGRRTFMTRVTFPAASGGTCPQGWTLSQ